MSTEIRSLLGDRLREERERLGLSQTVMAERGGVKMRTYQDWERGVSAVGPEYLAVVAAHGIDVLYVLTGTRTPVTDIVLTSDEAALLDNYKHSDEEGRAAARRVLSSLAQSRKAA